LTQENRFFALALTLCVFLGLANVHTAAAQAAKPAELNGAKGRVIILGFDGVEPTIVEKMLDAGGLPNLDKLRKDGAYRRLSTANPPQSPTAWSSFATCKDPGDHGIYDFLRRTPATYMPGVGFGTTVQAQLGPDGSVVKPAASTNIRKGETFWAAADRQGARCAMLHIPFAYPADDLLDSHMLCGLGVPDIRGTTSTFFYFSDAFTPAQLKEDLSGGMRVPLGFDGDTAIATFPGAYDSRKKGYVDTTLNVSADREARTVTVEAQGQSLTVPEGGWSEWRDWSFPVSDTFSVKAISRFFVLEAGERVRLYMTCLQFDPRDPYIPISEPKEYAKELAERYGLYKTIGWAEDTHALRQDAITDDAFLEDIARETRWRETLVLDELDRNAYNMLIAVWTGPDRISHLFWRFRDPRHPLYTKEGAAKYGQVVENSYKRMDQTVGKVMAKLGPDDLLMILSDHGFHSFHTEFNVNTWLVRNGYLGVKDQPDPATAYTETKFLQGYDWTKTRAYSIGLGSIYLNLQGREGKGTVAREEAPALVGELKDRLLQVTDPTTNDKVFDAVYAGTEIWEGKSIADAPDLQVGYAEGYQTGKASASGAAPKDIFHPNNDKWSGEHASSDVRNTPGIFFANQAAVDSPDIRDLGVTALEYLGVRTPEGFEGKGVLK
jgi:predicted AlkP superfamily phosphohydrolase/phosphomutase